MDMQVLPSPKLSIILERYLASQQASMTRLAPMDALSLIYGRTLNTFECGHESMNTNTVDFFFLELKNIFCFSKCLLTVSLPMSCSRHRIENVKRFVLVPN